MTVAVVAAAMTAAVVAVVVVGVVAAIVVALRIRRPVDGLNGVEGFRRHMDALSSDSRRDVIDRVRDARRDEEEE